MSVYKINDIDNLIKNNPYVGRGIIIGKSEDGANAVVAYFIMGRSSNSRNRIFVENGDEVVINPFDASKVEDPSLIIYSPIKTCDNKLIVTNGNQTDTIYNFLNNNKSFEDALETRSFEPDSPNFTPRISGLLEFKDNNFKYKMSILKSIDDIGSSCSRYTFSYNSINGLGHFIHTYNCDGTPLPSFTGEPERIKIPNNIDSFKNLIWNNLNTENRISLYVRYVNLQNGNIENRLVNSNLIN